jgi:uncharacterized membrane protein YsdA (DUF1294 family)
VIVGPEKRPVSSLRTWVAALAVGGIGTWSLFSATFRSGFDLFPGPRSDTRLIAYLMEQWYQALSGRANLLSPGWFYPVKHTLGYTDVLLGLVPIYAPLRAVGIDLFTALALTVVVVTVLDYVLCFLLLRRILRLNLLASCAGAFFFAFNDPKVAQPDHIQIQALYFLPIAAGALILLFRDLPNVSQRRAFALLAVAALALDLELLTAYYDAWFFVFWTAILLALALALGRTRALLVSFARRYVWPVAGGVGVFVVGLVPFLLIYLPVLRDVGTQPYAAAVAYIPEPRSFLLAADQNYIWQGLTTHLLGAHDPDYGRRLNIGAVATVGWLALSVLALLLVWRSRRAAAGEESRVDERTALLVLALGILAVDVVLVLALQYHGHSPWKIVYHVVPGAKGLRAISRDVIVLALPMAMVFAVAIHRLSAWVLRHPPGLARSGLGAVLLLVLAFAVVEQLNGNSYGVSYSIPAENAHLQRLAARLPTGCSAFYLALAPGHPHPLNRIQYQHDAMFVSIIDHVPTLNGRSAIPPRDWLLYAIKSPDYERNVRDWIQKQHIRGRVCRLAVSY